MPNIFLERNQYVPPIKRNSFDKSKLVNGTWRCGYLYPIDWEEVSFGDSLRTNIRAAIRTMPMVWPIQTPIICKFYQFYVRYRTLMKNFTDFRFGNKPIVHPFVSLGEDADFWKTGQLGDWLGVPTTYAGSNVFYRQELYLPTLVDTPSKSLQVAFKTSSYSDVTNILSSCQYTTPLEFLGLVRFFRPYFRSNVKSAKSFFFSHELFDVDNADLKNIRFFFYSYDTFPGLVYAKFEIEDITSYLNSNGDLIIPFDTEFSFVIGEEVKTFTLASYFESLDFSINHFCLAVSDSSSANYSGVLVSTNFPVSSSEQYFRILFDEGINELSDVNNPFAGSHPEIPLSALVPRAYEACYRSHFQDFQNEPFIIDGEAQYNRYITNDGDGADDTDYKLFRRNWEADPFTSAKPSPQQGLAPIVGVTEYGDITLTKDDGTDYTARLETGEDGVINGYSVRKDGQVSDQSVRRTLVELSTSGFTIERLRDVNAYQQWKEANIRRGLKFRDQVLSTFGVKLEYKELDMPEFLGGFSVPLNVDVINQTSSSVVDSPLGEIAGNGGFYGSSNHSMTKYADEEGIVMTLMCITPIPVYSQMLSRNWLRSNPLDYYNPQFGKIGNQPITYEEVCPVQAFNEGVDVHDVFGYQRPWYHMISSYDEVHGLMRNQMSGFVMQRIFGSTPELGADFLHIDENQMNEVFVVRDDEQDTFYGQILIDKKVKKGIPRFNVPSLT